MHRLIAEQAGHPAVAAMMRYVDHSAEPEPERLGPNAEPSVDVRPLKARRARPLPRRAT